MIKREIKKETETKEERKTAEEKNIKKEIKKEIETKEERKLAEEKDTKEKTETKEERKLAEENDTKEEKKYYEIKYYPGSISSSENRIRAICLKNKKYIFSKSFSISKYENALEEAIKFIKVECERLNLVIIQRVQILSLEQKQFIAGVFDGDGCIQFTIDKGLKMTVDQISTNEKPPDILKLFRDAFGGTISKPRIRKDRSHSNPEYCYLLCGKKCKPLLEIIALYGIIKSPQAQFGLECIRRTITPEANPRMKLNKKDNIFFGKVFAKAKEEYHLVPIDHGKITDAWLSGFFDAEGCIRMEDPRISMTYTQHGCFPILHAIQKKLGNIGSIRFGQLTIHSKRDVLSLIERIKPFSIQKNNQILLCESHLKLIISRNRKRRSEAEKELDKRIAKKCQLMKKPWLDANND